MLQKTVGIVLHVLKYNDTSNIVEMYTELSGRASFLVTVPRSKKATVKSVLFQPLALIEFEADYRPNTSLFRIKEAKSFSPFTSIPYDPFKSAIALFLAEFLYRAIREEAENRPLFAYLQHSILWLDTCKISFANFHLVFLMRLSRFLGLYPNLDDYHAGDYFDNFNLDYSVIEGEELVLAPTFKFTIDSITPDVSYEWYVDKKLQTGETGPTYTFKAEKSGTYQVTFAVTDNKTGVQFGKSTTINVRSIYQRGWVILSDDGGRSVLHFIVPTTQRYQVTYGGETFTRDSLVYHIVKRDIISNLGSNPKGLMNNIGEMDYNSEYGISVYDELVVKQDRWVELNGNTLEREVYTDEEFHGDIPADFSPVEAAMTFSSKALLDENGLIYWEKKADVTDFHAGTYMPIGLNNNTRFSRLFQAYKFNDYITDVMLALTEEDNSLVGILDMGYATSGTVITENSSYTSGNMYNITDPSGEDHFSNIEKTVVDALPAPYNSGNDITESEPYWTVLLKDEATSVYELRYFGLEAERRYVGCLEGWYYEASLGVINDYRGMANFGNKRYVVIASGNQLYYYQYGWDAYGDVEYRGELMPLGEPLPAAVKTLSGMDVTTNLYKQKYPYAGQLGVALEDGSFYIFGVVETRLEDGTCTEVSLKQQFPNETTSEENKKFGKIVDVLYKLGRGMDYMSFAF